ncbi:MAG: hypothetical protein WD810_03155 [Solirubrobacterales bacterium]
MKALGLAVVAVLAMSVVVASAAQASEFEASNSEGTVSGTGSGNEEFITEAGKVVCQSSTFHGTYATKNAASQSLHPAYSECQAFGFLSATVNTEKCNYVFTPGSTIETDKYNSSVAIDCPEGNSIKITASTCSAEVKDVAANQELTNTTLTNATESTISALPNVTGIAYTVTKDGFLCPFSGTGDKTGGEYKSTAAVTMSASGGASIQVVD